MAMNFAPTASSGPIKFEDSIALAQIAFDWAEAYDTKNWDQLRSIMTPTFTADYTEVLGPDQLWADITAEKFVENMTNILGHSLLGTQHLLGATKWYVLSNTVIVGTYQIRVAHQRFKDDKRDVVLAECNCHGKITHHYSLHEGKWKLSGLKPSMYWLEPNFEKVFAFGEG